MSIRPPSDIVMDVALAADPAERQRATRRLAGGDAESGNRFASALDGASGLAPTQPAYALATNNRAADSQAKPRTPAEAMSALQTFFLRTAFETMLPKAPKSGTAYASASSDMWRSTLADVLANQVSSANIFHLAAAQKSTT